MDKIGLCGCQVRLWHHSHIHTLCTKCGVFVHEATLYQAQQRIDNAIVLARMAGGGTTNERGEWTLQMKYFVLEPRGDDPYATASREALFAYAEAIEHHDPELAKRLCDWADAEVHRGLAS